MRKPFLLLLAAVLAGCASGPAADTLQERETIQQEESKTPPKFGGIKDDSENPTTKQETKTTPKFGGKKDDTWKETDQNAQSQASGEVRTPYFTVAIPSSWSGKVQTESGSRNGGGYWLKFIDISSQKAGAGGVIGTIMMIPAAEDFSNIPETEWVAMLTDGKESYNLILVSPTDLQFTPATEDAWRILQEQMEEAAWNITGVSPWQYTITGR